MIRLLGAAVVVLMTTNPWAVYAQQAHEFKEFNCANLSPAWMSRPDLWRALNLGMARHEVWWHVVQPTRGRWDFTQTDATLLLTVEQVVPAMAMLGYTAPWAAMQEPYSFEYHGLDPTGSMVHQRWEISFADSAQAGGLKQPILTKVNLHDGTRSEPAEVSLGNIPPARTKDWLRYVDRVVARYSGPPWNIQYWQIWNEFNWPDWYYQDWHHFIDNVHIPAARVIRKYGCKVVFGGWACTQGAAELNELLAYHDAWKYTDIVDFHYLTNSAFQETYDAWIKTGRCYGIWTTETGWTDWPGFLPNGYARLFYWALTHDWQRPDQYKAFWFHFTSVPSQPGLTHFGDGPTRTSYIGDRLRTLANLLPGRVRPFSDFECEPALPFDLTEEHASSEGFRTGNAVVIALHLPEGMLADTPTVTIRVPRLPGRLLRAEAYKETGEGFAVEATPDGDGLRVVVPTDGLQADVWRFEARGVTAYVRLQVA
jgi:hypothetical protein